MWLETSFYASTWPVYHNMNGLSRAFQSGGVVNTSPSSRFNSFSNGVRMMTRVLILGVDGLDSSILARYAMDLPNFARLLKSGAGISCQSVQPPDSNSAWASIYTGMNPAKHGIVHFTDPLERVGIISTSNISNSSIKGRTFWDIAGRQGKRVCLVFPHLTYPGWEVNGVMISRSTVHDACRTHPHSVAQDYDFSRLYNMPGFPKGEKHFQDYIDLAHQLILGEEELGLKLLRSEPWDLFFLYSAALDSIKHFFWSYCDPEDPTHPYQNPYQDAIKDLYRLHDRILGRFLEEVGPDTTLLVLSDHGHGMRPVRILNINEWLRQEGLLRDRGGALRRTRASSLVNWVKRKALGFVVRHNLGNLALKLIVVFPWVRRWYSASGSIDWERTAAYLPDLSGMKAYAYGGIRVREEGLGGRDHDRVCEQIIEGLLRLEDPETGERVARWVCRREELYEGEHLSQYPDVVFYLRDEYGAGGNIHVPLFDRALTHSIVPGSHRAHTATFLMHNSKIPKARDQMDVMDVAPTVLDILGIEHEGVYDGRSLFSPEVS